MRKRFYGHSFRAVLFLLGVFFVAGSVQVNAQKGEGVTVTAANIYGVTTGNQLVRFNSANPGTLVTIGAITGLQGGETVIGIDFRPATGQLFAVGSASRLYVVNKTTAAATFVAVLSTALNGTEFGVDFNPTVDRLRIVSDTGQNLRVNPANGAVTNDANLNPGTPHVTAAGYTNSFFGATTTTLYDIDTNNDTLYTQNPPNNGTLVTVGALGTNVGDANGFDISPIDGTAYLVASPAIGTGNPMLYTVNLASGAATAVGSVGGAANLIPIRGIAVETGATTNSIGYAVTTSNNLIRFNTSRPNTLLGAPTAITGLQTGENILGIDFRPATGQLYALGSTSRLYTINIFTGAASAVGAAGAFTLNGTAFGFDFNPVPDRIRVVSDTDQNLRLNPNDGTITGTDTTLQYAAGDPNNAQNPNITAAGYTNSFAGATATTLYDIDTNLDILATQNPPNNGTLNTVGSLGVNVSAVNGFDITTGSNSALAALQVQGVTNSGLYSINLTTGAASIIGPIGGGQAISAFAVGRSTAAGASTATLDFDGDGRTDNVIDRFGDNTYYINRSSNNSFYTVQFGLAGSDVQTPGDYDADGRTDVAVWRPSTGIFYIFRSSDATVQAYQFGINGDEPVARDYDGDGKTDYAVARRTGGQLIWYINNSANNSFRIEQFGLDIDVAVPGDYDGDGRFDLGAYRGSGGGQATYYVQRSTLGFTAVSFGLGSDLVVPGDYDGDGKTDYAVVRQGSQFTWYILRSSDSSVTIVNFGTKPQYTTQGDYDGDGRTDISTFDPSGGIFYVFRSFNNAVLITQFGQNGDYPVANYDTH
ncbi:MAG: DUF4394 domain-containing protein [Pyrinomonadaceae bacterium]